MVSKERNSTFEFMRIIAMFVIVFYHMLCCYEELFTYSANMHFVRSLMPMVHWGVLLFVLISGYFGIRASAGGFLKLMGVVLLYYVPIELIYWIHDGGFTGGYFLDGIRRFELFSYTPYWFIRSYLILFAVSPMLNLYLKNATSKQKTLFLVVLGLISCWVGNSMPWQDWQDSSLTDGKNVMNFMFLYVLGHLLHETESIWKQCSNLLLIGVFVLLNAISFILLFYVLPVHTELYAIVYKIMFAYNGFILILNSVLIFMVFGHWNFISTKVNSFAGSMFAVYIIHCDPCFMRIVVNNLVKKAVSISGDGLPLLLLKFVGIALVLLVGCVGIDKIMKPIWILWNKVCNRVDDKMKELMA